MPKSYLIPYPQAGTSKVVRESKKQAANLPKPPFPRPASVSYSYKSSRLYPNSIKASLKC